MHRSMRHLAVRTSLLALSVLALGAMAASTASAEVYSNMDNWYVDTSFDPYGTNFTVSSGGPNPVQFRWLDSPSKATTIYATHCADGTLIGLSRSYAVGSVDYQTLFTGSSGTCFRLWGATASGSMSDHDGRVLR